MEKEENKEIRYSARILNIRLVDFYTLPELPDNYVKDGLDKNKVQFEFNIGFHIDMQNRTIHVDLNTIFFAELGKNTKLGNINTSADFEVLNLDELITNFNGKIPNIILANFIGIVISTSRGFFILKSAGTIMDGINMPIVNIDTFFPKSTALHADE